MLETKKNYEAFLLFISRSENDEKVRYFYLVVRIFNTNK